MWKMQFPLRHLCFRRQSTFSDIRSMMRDGGGFLRILQFEIPKDNFRPWPLQLCCMADQLPCRMRFSSNSPVRPKQTTSCISPTFWSGSLYIVMIEDVQIRNTKKIQFIQTEVIFWILINISSCSWKSWIRFECFWAVFAFLAVQDSSIGDLVTD